METLSYLPREFSAPATVHESLTEENVLLRKEIQVAREAADITAKLVVKQFEETEKILRRLQVANAQRKAVLDSAIQISIIATDKDGLITVFNTGAENLLGYRADEIIGKWTPEIFHLKSELNMVSQNLSSKYGYNVEGFNVFYELAIRGRLAQQEWSYVRKDGTQFPVRMTINTLREPYGGVSGLLFIAMDIAEKKRSEKALMESERKYRLLVRNLPNCVYKGYFDGTIDFFDDKIEQITGYRKEEFLSRKMSWYSFVHDEDLKCAKERFKQALRTDNSYIREYRIKSKSGDIIWIQDSGQIIYGENSEVEFITGAFLDITERKLAEKALHESEEKYRSLFNSGPDPIFVLDCTTQKILDANPMAQETYGYLKEDLIGRPFKDLGSLDDIMEGLADFSEDEWPNACAVSSKAQHYKKGHVSFFVRVTACPTRYRDRDAIILAATDITEMLEREAQLLQASKMTTLGKMSAGIAHELNQPLNAINMGSEYLTMMVEEGKKISRENLVEVARQISEQVDRASEIMNRLREFGRKPDFARKKVDLNRAIRIVHGIVAQQLKLQNIIVNLELEENIPFILAHNTRLEQVTFNLVTNAQDAICQKTKVGLETGASTITIRTFTENDQVAVTVADKGIGIPENVRHKVFEPFFTTKEVGKGMGLGLSITYGIVKDYNGQIEIQSREGFGTTIKLTFPCADA